LGKTGRNFAAGMSGGIAFVFDTDNTFPSQVNKEMVALEELEQEDLDLVYDLLSKHALYTGSDVADAVVKNWHSAKAHFVKVMPTDYKKVLMTKKAQAAATSLS
jgi:glutamate synthase (NADPH/NADH) large chain